MGVVSISEDIETKRQEAEFVEGKRSPEIEQLLKAPAAKRAFSKKSKPAPKLKKPKKQLKQEAQYRKVKQRATLSSVDPAVQRLQTEVQRLRDENQRLMKQLADHNREITRLRTGK